MNKDNRRLNSHELSFFRLDSCDTGVLDHRVRLCSQQVEKNDGPVQGIRSIQAALVVTTGLMVYFGVRIFVG